MIHIHEGRYFDANSDQRYKTSRGRVVNLAIRRFFRVDAENVGLLQVRGSIFRTEQTSKTGRKTIVYKLKIRVEGKWKWSQRTVGYHGLTEKQAYAELRAEQLELSKLPR